jgi:hypothetical protein
MKKKYESLIETLILVVITIAVLTLLFILHTANHEEVHRVIFETYGCENITSHYYAGGLSGSTSCTWNKDTPQRYIDDATKLQLENELRGYNNKVLIVTIVLTGMLLIGGRRR